MKLVALTGRAGSGKSSVARVLEAKYSYYLANFTDQIKEVAAERQGVTVEYVLQHKAQFRGYLQDLATYYGFDEGGYWVWQALKKCGWTQKIEHPMVFDNVRTDGQAETLKALNIPIIQLVVRPEVAYRRLGNPDLSFLEHAVERGISPHFIANVVDGEQPAEEVARRIARLPDMLASVGRSGALYSMWDTAPVRAWDSAEAVPGLLGTGDSEGAGRGEASRYSRGVWSDTGSRES